jgi:hypothetical protein
MVELPKDKPLVGSAFLLTISIKEALISFGKGVNTMTYTVTIGIGMVVVMLLFTGNVNGAEMGPSAVDEQIAIAKSYVEIKCDPCDYNIDYGDTYHLGEKEGVDEGVVKLECDPCDYDIDYGDTYHSIEK